MSGDMLPVLSPFVTKSGSMSGVARLLSVKPERWGSIIGVRGATICQRHFETMERLQTWTRDAPATVNIEMCHVQGQKGVYCPMTKAQRAVTRNQWASGYPLSLVLCVWVHSVDPLVIGCDGGSVLVTTEMLQGREQFGVTAVTDISRGTLINGCPLTMMERHLSDSFRLLPTHMNDATTVKAEPPNKHCRKMSYIHPFGFASSRDCCAVLMNAGYFDDGTASAAFVNVRGGVMVEITHPVKAGQPILVNYKRTLPIFPPSTSDETIQQLLDTPGHFLLRTITEDSWTLISMTDQLHQDTITTMNEILYLNNTPTNHTSLETLLTTLPQLQTPIQCREDFSSSPNTFCQIKLPETGDRWPQNTTITKLEFDGTTFSGNGHSNISWRSAYHDGQISLFVLYVLLACPRVPVTIHNGIVCYYRNHVIDVNGNSLKSVLERITDSSDVIIPSKGSIYSRITSVLQSHNKKWFKVACPHDVVTTGNNPFTYIVRIITLEYGEWAILEKDELTVFIMKSSTNPSRKYPPQPQTLASPPSRHMCGISFAVGIL